MMGNGNRQRDEVSIRILSVSHPDSRYSLTKIP